MYSGSDYIDDVAWFYENSGNKTHKVGKKIPNELGLFDLTGNAWEWCWDWYDEDYYYLTNSERNPLGPESGSYRVCRGGSWGWFRSSSHITIRIQGLPYIINNTVGFRIVKSANNITDSEIFQNGETHNKNKIEKVLQYLGEMIFVRGGSFNMGEEDGKDSNPVHQVYLDDFYINKFEVTQKEWIYIMEGNLSRFKGDFLPVDSVSWYDAVEFCNKKSLKEGLTPCYKIDKSKKDHNNLSEYDKLKWIVTCDINTNGYRLPTEAEWEYAARGGNQSKGYMYSGSDYIDDVAWFYENSGNKTHKVGKKIPNELGLFDMTGNVSEWCWDWYYKDYYKTSPIRNPIGPTSGKMRIRRGFSYVALNFMCQTTSRSCFEISPDCRFEYGSIGFRLARSAKQ